MSYHPIIQQTINYMEEHLEEELSLEKIARSAGFSMFHYHRIFQAEIGMTITEYVRTRRIVGAAVRLLYTNERILDIAFHYRFESQEAFTRAFKKIYHLPPGRYRKLMNKVNQQKEELPMNTPQPVKGWFLSGSHPFHYEMGIDRHTVHKGRASGYLKSMMVESAEQFGTMMQAFKADHYRGERIKLSAFIKTDDVKQFAAMWMRVDSASDEILQFDNMSNRPITGSNHWNHYSIVLDVPPASAAISFGVLLNGSGCVWADGFAFETVDLSVPSTNLEVDGGLHDEPLNLSFEEE